MKLLPDALGALVSELSKLPGVGERSALRYAVALLRSGRGSLEDLSRALTEVHEEVGHCKECFFWDDKGSCPLCENPKAENATLCVVRDCPDVLALERFRHHGWRFHILQGLLSPLSGVGPKDIRLDELFSRIDKLAPNEIIIALDATVEGDATALYIKDRISEDFPQLKLSRTALGLPAGSSVEYLDPSTLEHALNHRTNFS